MQPIRRVCGGKPLWLSPAHVWLGIFFIDVSLSMFLYRYDTPSAFQQQKHVTYACLDLIMHR